MVVKEGDQIDPSVLAIEHEGKEIGLPELIGPCALKTPRVVGMQAGRRLVKLVTHLVQDTDDHRGARRQSRALKQRIANPLAAPGRLRLLKHTMAQRVESGSRLPFSRARLIGRPSSPEPFDPLLPGVKYISGDFHQGCEILGGQAAALSAVKDEESLPRGELLELWCINRQPHGRVGCPPNGPGKTASGSFNP